MYDTYYLDYLATIDKTIKSCIDVLHPMDPPLFDNSGSELEILVWDNNKGNHSLFVPEGDTVDLTPYLKEIPVPSDQRNLPDSVRLRGKGLRLIVEYLELKRKKLGLPEGKYQLSRESEGSLRIVEKNGTLALIAYVGNQLTPITEPPKTSYDFTKVTDSEGRVSFSVLFQHIAKAKRVTAGGELYIELENTPEPPEVVCFSPSDMVARIKEHLEAHPGDTFLSFREPKKREVGFVSESHGVVWKLRLANIGQNPLSFYFHSSGQMNLLLDLIVRGIDPSTVKEGEAEALASGLWGGAEVEEGYTEEKEPEPKTVELEAAFASGAVTLREVLELFESGALKPSETENARVLSSLWRESTQEKDETLQSYLNDAEVQRRSLPLGLSGKEAEKYLQQLQSEAEKLKEEEQKAPQEPSTTPDPDEADHTADTADTADTSVAQGIGLAVGISLMLSAMKHSSSTSTPTRVSSQEHQPPSEAAEVSAEEIHTQRSNPS
jgi:hypothetical protein